MKEPCLCGGISSEADADGGGQRLDGVEKCVAVAEVYAAVEAGCQRGEKRTLVVDGRHAAGRAEASIRLSPSVESS